METFQKSFNFNFLFSSKQKVNVNSKRHTCLCQKWDWNMPYKDFTFNNIMWILLGGSTTWKNLNTVGRNYRDAIILWFQTCVSCGSPFFPSSPKKIPYRSSVCKRAWQGSLRAFQRSSGVSVIWKSLCMRKLLVIHSVGLFFLFLTHQVLNKQTL